MPKLKYGSHIDGVTVKAVHVGHQQALYFDLLMPAVDSLVEKELTVEEDPLLLEVGPAMVGWAKDENCVLGFVSVFHLWERQFRELLREQKASQGVDIPKQESREGLVAYARRVLEEYFEVRGLEPYWDELSRALAVVNAFKHGQGQKFDAVLKQYPDYFYVQADRNQLPMVSITQEQLRNLIRTLEEFWSAIPVEVEYRI